MAQLLRDGESLILELSPVEKLEGVHGNLSAPVATVASITALDNAIEAVRGWKLPGSRIPGVFAMGTFVSGPERVFAIVHHHPASGVKISFQSGEYTAWIVSTNDPKALIATLGF